jgi:hypothetical protein
VVGCATLRHFVLLHVAFPPPFLIRKGLCSF